MSKKLYKKIFLKGTASVYSNDPLCKDCNAMPLTALSDN